MKGLTFERLFWPTTRIAFFTIVLLVGFQFASVPSETRATALCFIPVLLLVWIPFWDAHRSARRSAQASTSRADLNQTAHLAEGTP